MRTFKQHTINEGQLQIDFKKFKRVQKDALIDLLKSTKTKRKFNLDSVTSPSLDRFITVRAYYTDLDDLRDYLKDVGYEWKNGKMSRGKPLDITMESSS